MHTTPLATDVQRYLESCSPAGLTLLDLDIVEDVAELTLAFTPEALDQVLRNQLRITGAPSDWDCPKASMEAGTPTWAYALDMAYLFNEHYFGHLLLERHEAALGQILAVHGNDGTPVVFRPAYTPDCLALSLRRLKAEHLRAAGLTAPQVRAA
ncbi:hypothetical protein AVL61_06590 [Kocuria rosea subsp. polaris]|uniref:Uncharacterized protein n=1 Tax=Kocuria rosea subsp. polaris TaxID=136273 RepID=A0A0W8I9V5_KOCRO|nr:hypothetical protein [Kocuria polaris]KUG56713.1 hypothetical protein AVL61_06590 [Kocuria polaris]